MTKMISSQEEANSNGADLDHLGTEHSQSVPSLPTSVSKRPGAAAEHTRPAAVRVRTMAVEKFAPSTETGNAMHMIPITQANEAKNLPEADHRVSTVHAACNWFSTWHS